MTSDQIPPPCPQTWRQSQTSNPITKYIYLDVNPIRLEDVILSFPPHCHLHATSEGRGPSGTGCLASQWDSEKKKTWQ